MSHVRPAIVDNPGRRAYTTVSHTGPKTDGFTDQLQRCAKPEAVDHSHLMLRFEHARSTHYSEDNPLSLIGQTNPRIVYRSINARVGTVDKARRFGGRSQNG